MRPFVLALFLFLMACESPQSKPGITPAPGSIADLRWETLAPAPNERGEVAAAALGEDIYVIGGLSSDGASTSNVDIYDTNADSWRSGPELPIAVNHPMAATLEKNVYLLGGYSGAGPSSRVFRLDGSGWVEEPSMPGGRAAAGAAAIGGKIYVVGGIGDQGLAQSMYGYEAPSKKWSEAQGMPTPREHLGVAALAPYLFAVGGRSSVNFATAENFDTRNGTWARVADMPSARGGSAAGVTSNGFLVSAGGEADRTFDSAELLDLQSGKWFLLPPMPTARHGLGVVGVGTKIYVISGGKTPGLAVSGINEAIDLQPLRKPGEIRKL